MSILPMLVGPAIGIGGVFIGYQELLARARDEEERRDLGRMTTFTLVSLVASCVAMALITKLINPLWATLAFPILTSWLIPVFLIWQPQIIARRQRAEVAREPAAARRQQREAWQHGLSVTAGLLFGYLLVAMAAVRYLRIR